MPTYDYVCEKCGDKFEVFQSMKDDKLTDCPQDTCEGPIRRLFGTGAGIIFKGGGFYQTDYRSESYKQGAKKEGEAPSMIADALFPGIERVSSGTIDPPSTALFAASAAITPS